MLQKKEIFIILLFVVSCFSTAWSGAETPTVRAGVPTKAVKTVPRQPSVLVGAFMVRVSTEALSKVGVTPIGQALEGVSMLKILACLDDPEENEIISASKLLAHNGDKASLQDTRHITLKTERGGSMHYERLDRGKTFSVFVRLVPEKTILVQYTYSESSFEENEDKQSPPTTFSYDWQGSVSMSTGKPIIAGVSQKDDSVIFLIMTATIQDCQVN